MPELTDRFTNLYNQYQALFPLTTHQGVDRTSLMATFPAPQRPGVYLIWRNGETAPLYIGSSGKLGPGLVPSGSTVKSRLFGANTPYHFDHHAPVWRYGPTAPGVPPPGYHHQVPIADITITSFALPHPQAPSALEHVLLQGFINQYGKLPIANQKI